MLTACESCEEPEGRIARRICGTVLCEGCHAELPIETESLEEEIEFFDLRERGLA